MSVYINTLEVENLKRIKAVKIDCSGNSLTVIGGKNGQGKTSVLDAVAYALGGERYRPTNAKREGSMVDPEIKLTLSNGIVVERRGKNSALKVTDPNGGRSGQSLLNSFIHQFAIDLPRFLNASNREKADELLKVIGVGDKLLELEKEESRLYNERHAVGRVADQKKKYAEEMRQYSDVPDEMVSASELIKEQQAILAKNGDNERKREQLGRYQAELPRVEEEVEQLEKRLIEAKAKRDELKANIATAKKSVEQLRDESTADIERRLGEIDEINSKVRANLDKAKALDDAAEYQKQYANQGRRLDEVRKAKRDLLEGANLPLEGLAVEGGELIYKGQKWDCMSSSEQLMVGTAIVRSLNPECGFVLIDQLEKMDLETLREFGKWLESEGLQAIATRVSTGEECSIIIEDGNGETTTSTVTKPKYNMGEF